MRPVPLTRGRRLALAVGLPVLLAFIAYSGILYVSIIGWGSIPVQRALVVSGEKVAVAVGSGNVAATPGGSGRALVAGRVHYTLFRPRVRWETTATGPRLRLGSLCGWLANCTADLTLSVPPDLGADVSSGSGNVSAQGLTGGAVLRSGSGNVRVERLSGALSLRSGSGNITGGPLASTQVQARDGSGNVELAFSGPPDSVTVTDGSGNITVVLPAGVAYDVVATSGSGRTDIGVINDPSSPRRIDLHTGSGNVRVEPSGS